MISGKTNKFFSDFMTISAYIGILCLCYFVSGLIAEFFEKPSLVSHEYINLPELIDNEEISVNDVKVTILWDFEEETGEYDDRYGVTHYVHDVSKSWYECKINDTLNNEKLYCEKHETNTHNKKSGSIFVGLLLLYVYIKSKLDSEQSNR